MIARYREAVVYYSKPVLFKPQSRQRLQQQIKLSFFAWLCLVFCPGERGEGIKKTK